MSKILLGGEGLKGSGYNMADVIKSGLLQKGSPVLFEPALTRDALLETSNDNWWHTLNNSIDNINILQNKGELNKIRNEYLKNELAIREGKYNSEDDLNALKYKSMQYKEQMNPYIAKIDENQKDIDEHYITSDYQYNNIRAQQEEESNVLDYLFNSGEFAEDLGGSMSELKTQGILMARSIARPYVKKAVGAIGSKMAAEIIGKANPWVAGAMLTYDAASLLGSAYATYQMRKRETLAEEAGALETRYNSIMESIANQREIPVEQLSSKLTQEDKDNIELEAYKGMQAVHDVNMNLGVMDFAQGMILVAPFGKWLGKLAPALSTKKIVGELIGTAIKTPLEIISEAQEEGIQTLVQGKQQRGDYDKYTGGGILDGYKENLNLLSETTKGILGISNEPLANTADFRNSVRSGAIIGALLGGPVSISQTGREVVKYLQTSRDLNDPNAGIFTQKKNPSLVGQFVNSRIEDEEKASKIDRIISMHDKGRSEYINDVIENADKFSDTVTKEDIAKTKDLVDKTIAAANHIDNDNAYSSIHKSGGNIINPEGKVSNPTRNQAIKLLVQTELNRDANVDRVNELTKSNSSIYSDLSQQARKQQNNLDIDEVTKQKRLDNQTQLFTLQSHGLNQRLEHSTKIKELQEERQNKINKLAEHYLDEAGVKEQENLINSDIASRVKQLEEYHGNDQKILNAQIKALETNLRSLDFNHINISDPNIQRINELRNKQKQTIAQINLAKELIAKTEENPDDVNSTDNVQRKELLKKLQGELYMHTMQEAEYRNNIIDSILGIDKNQKDISAVNNKIDDVIEELPKDKAQELQKNDFDKVQFERDIRHNNEQLKRWKEPKNLIEDAKNVSGYYNKAAAQQDAAQVEKETVQSGKQTTLNDIPEPINVDEYHDPNAPKDNRVDVRKNKETVKVIIQHPLSRIDDAISYSHAMSQSEIVARDKELVEYLSTFTNGSQLDKAKVLFSIDKSELSKDTAYLVEHGNITISIVMPDGTTFDQGLSLHLPSYVFDDNTGVGHFKADEWGKIEHERDNVKKLRAKIINYLKQPDVIEVFVEGVRRTAGIINNTGVQRGIFDAWGIKHGDVKFYVVDSGGTARTEIGSIDKTGRPDYTPGIVMVETNRTVNGQPIRIKMNSSKLTEEHAGMLWEAMLQRFEGGQKLFEHEGAKGLKVSDVIDLLTVEGGQVILPAGATVENLDAYEQQKYNKQLWNENGTLYFGGNTIEKFTKGTKEQKAANKAKFVEWATKNKNYPVRLYRQFLLGGVEPNSNVKQSFQLGAWKYEYDANTPITYGELLASVPVDGKGQYALTSDVAPYGNTGSLTHSPVAMISKSKSDDVNVQTTVKNSKNKVTPKAKAKLVVLENKPVNKDGYKSVSINDARTLQESGTQIYVQVSPGEYDPIDPKYSVNDYKGMSLFVANEQKVIALPTEKQLDKIEEEQEEVIDLAGHIVENPEEGVPEVKSEAPKTETEFITIDTNKPAVESDDDTINLLFGKEDTEDKKVPRVLNYSKPYYTKADIDREVAEIKRMLGENFSIKIVDDFIKLAESGKLAFSTFERDCITLAQMMEEGSGYHEALHRVTYLLLDPKQRQELYRQARAKYSTKLKEEYGNKLYYTDEEVDEVLAEEFRSYVLDMENRQSKLFGAVKQLFDKIVNWLKYYVFKRNPMSSSELDALFPAIYSGKLRYAKVNSDNYKALGYNKVPRIVRETNIPEIDTAEQVDSMVKSLVGNYILKSDIITIGELEHINYSKIIEYVEGRASNARAKTLRTDISESDKANWIRLSKLYDAVTNPDNWTNVWKPLINDYLKQLSVKINSSVNEDSDSISAETNEENFMVKADKNPVEIDYKNNALPAIKFLISVLPNSKEVNPFHGLMEFDGFDENWRTLLRELHYLPKFEDMYSKISSLAKTNVSFQALKYRLDQGDVILHNQFYQVMSKHRHNFVNLNLRINKDGNIAEHYWIDALLQNEANALSNRKTGGQWGVNFQDTPLVKREQGKSARININVLNALNKEHQSLMADVARLNKAEGVNASLTDIQDKFIKLLSKVGIVVDNDTLDYASEYQKGENAAEKYYNLVSRAGSIFNPKTSNLTKYQQYISGVKLSDKDKADMSKLTMATVVPSESFVGELAKYHIQAHLYKANDMVSGPANKPFYVYSENNIVSDVIHDINNDKEFVELKLSAINNRHSYILNKIRNADALRKALRVVTFSAFDDEESSEDSLEYLGMNEIENYTMKLLAATAGYLPFPVLASKKLYYMFDGVKGFGLGNNLVSSVKETNNELDFSDDVINLFHGYFLDEKNTLDKIKSDIAKDESTKSWKGLIENIHYIVTDKGNIARNPKFETFVGFNKTDINLEDETQVKAEIKNMLNAKLEEELKYAQELGIIVEQNGQWKNQKLPGKLVGEYNGASKGGFTAQNGLKALVSDSMINQMIGILETEKLISGDPLCYKPSKKTGSPVEDQIKRLSVLSSTGAKFVESMVDKYSKDGQPFDKDLSDTTYRVMTLAKNKNKYDGLKQLIDAHASIYISEGMSKEEAEKLAESTLGAYKGNDSTDAQAFITPMMYRQIKMRLGEWSDYKQAAFEALMSDRELTAAELKEHRKFFMEPLKLVYFGHDIEKDGLDTVVYDKMSLATLFHRDIKGLQIEDLYNAMIKNGIHMQKFDSAIKAGASDRGEFFDESKENTTDFNKIPVKEQQWKYLRRQLMTDPHDEDSQKVGTQMIKVILSNIIKDDARNYNIDGVNYSGNELISTIFKSLKSISNSGADRIYSKFGMKDGNSLADDTLLINYLKDEAEKGKMPHAVIESLFTQEGHKANSLDLLAKRDWVINRLISYISKETVDINLPGKSLVQQSNIGFRVDKSDDLKFYITDKKGLQEMEVDCSISLFKNVIPNYVNLTDEQRKDWVNNNPEVLGYRIPTQGQSSIVAMRVRKFLSESLGDVIVLPSEFTALTGSDFDIDKLYTIRYNYKMEGGKANIIKFHAKTEAYKKTHEGILEDKVRNGNLSKEELDDIEKQLTELGSFKSKYNAKIKELYAKYRNILASKYNDKFGALNEEIEAYYNTIDEQNASIKAKKNEALDLLLQYNSTKDESLLTQRRNLLDEIDAMRGEDSQYAEAVYDLKIAKQSLLNEIASALISEGKLKNRIDFLLADEFEQNTNKAVQNRLISSMFAVLKSKKHLIHVTKPLDSLNETLKDMANEISRVVNKDLASLDRLTPKFQSKTKQQYASGKMGVPFAALHNVHHALSQAVGLGIYDTALPIGEDYKENGYVVGKRLDRQKGDDGKYISDWINALLNAFVDIEKDPYIISLNINNTTYASTYFMLRLGVGQKTFDFMSQTSIKQLAKYDALSKGVMTEFDNYKHAYNKLHSELTTELNKAIASAKINKSELVIPDPFDADLLSQGRFSPRKDKLQGKDLAQYYLNQLTVLGTFNALKERADLLQELVSVSQIDTKKFGSNYAEMTAFMNRFKGVKDRHTFINQDKLFEDTHLNTLLNNSVILTQNILNNKMIEYTSGFQIMLQDLYQSVGREYSNDEKLINSLTKELYTQVISEFFTNPEYLGATEKDIDRLFYSKESIANKVFDIQAGKFLPNTTDRNRRINNWLKERKIFTDLLRPEFPDNQPSYLRVAFRKDSNINPDLIMESFKDLFMSTDPEIKQLAKDLILYSYFASGRKMGVFSIFQHISPKEYGFIKGNNNISFNEFLKIKSAELQRPEYLSSNYDNIIDNTIKNAWHLNSVVPTLFKETRSGKPIIPEKNILRYGGILPRAFKVSNQEKALSIGTNEMKQPLYKRYVKTYLSYKESGQEKYIQVLGEYVGYDKNTNEPFYKVVQKSSISSKGNVVKENGLYDSRVWSNSMPKDLYVQNTEKYIATMVNDKKGFESITHIPKSSQVINNDRISDRAKTYAAITQEVSITQEQLQKINEKFVGKFENNILTIEEFNSLSKEEQQNLLNCL